jgi:glycine/D-amino acid oxidase-like deaminating enzyme
MSGFSHPYWLETPSLKGSKEKPRDAEIVIIGSGLSGVSTAYWLQEKGYTDLLLVDFEPDTAATFRNCGHILYGTVESMQALVALHGEEVARKLWTLSIDVCHEVRETIKRHQIEAHYRQDGYLVIAIDESEDREIQLSIELLNKNGFGSHYVSRQELEKKGFRKVHGGRFEPGSAQAHPTLFRNGLLEVCLKRGLRYHSGVKVTAVEEQGEKVRLRTEAWGDIFGDAIVQRGPETVRINASYGFDRSGLPDCQRGLFGGKERRQAFFHLGCRFTGMGEHVNLDCNILQHRRQKSFQPRRVSALVSGLVSEN